MGNHMVFFCYYNRSSKLDSIKEYILLYPDSTLSGNDRSSCYIYDTINAKRKTSYLNTTVSYSMNGEVIPDKSYNFYIRCNNDTIEYGKEVVAEIKVAYPYFGINNSSFKIFLKETKSPLKLIELIPNQDGKNLFRYTVKPSKKGLNYIQGFIYEYKNNKPDDVNYMFFKESYWVK